MKRKLYLFKNRVQVWLRHLTEKILLKLSEWRIITCHKVNFSNIYDDGDIQHSPDIVTDRYIFSVSYVLRKIETVHEYWFQFKNGGRRIFICEDYHHCEGRVSYRAELKAFYCHFSPKHRMWVDHTRPTAQFLVENMEAFDSLETRATRPIEVKTHRCDFSQCRYAFEFSYDLDTNKDMSSEVISQSYRVLGNQLRSKQTEINKILTGADYDGEMMSHKNMPLCDNILCVKCGLPVFASTEGKYMFECLNHGNLNVEDVRRVDPVTYEDTMRYCMDYLEALIKRKSVRQDSNL